MSWATGAQAHLQEATGLAAVLSDAYEAFEGMLLVIRAHESRAEDMSAAFVMSAVSAANGRDAVAAAPTLPRIGGGIYAPAGSDLAAAADVKQIARELSSLARVLADRLAEAARLASDPADRAASTAAVGHARNICMLLSGAEP
jgi:hypothetical protein